MASTFSGRRRSRRSSTHSSRPRRHFRELAVGIFARLSTVSSWQLTVDSCSLCQAALPSGSGCTRKDEEEDMSNDLVQVPRSLIEELVSSLERAGEPMVSVTGQGEGT